MDESRSLSFTPFSTVLLKSERVSAETGITAPTVLLYLLFFKIVPNIAKQTSILCAT